MSRQAAARWRVTRGCFRPRGVHWSPLSTGSTNPCWRGSDGAQSWFLKWFRDPQPGLHPEIEVALFLRAKGFRGTPEFGASLERVTTGGQRHSTAIVTRWEQGPTAWDALQHELTAGSGGEPLARQLGANLASLHRVLASGAPGTAFEQTRDPHYSRRCVERAGHTLEKLRALLHKPMPGGFEGATWTHALNRCEAIPPAWATRFQGLSGTPVACSISRIHGDLHLGQILLSENGGSLFTDFEGEPLRTLAERRICDSPLRDVAGMWRSFSYAASVAGATPEAARRLQDAFLDAWISQMPPEEPGWQSVLDVLILEKNLYELLYELQNRPGWAHIPLGSLP